MAEKVSLKIIPKLFLVLKVSLQQIVDHVLQNVKGLKSISRDVIHRLLQAPQQGTTASKRYNGVTDARVPAERNNKADVHSDFQYTVAQVNYVKELMFYHPG